VSSGRVLFIIVTGSGEDYGWSEHARMAPFQPGDNIDVAMVFWGKNFERQELKQLLSKVFLEILAYGKI
jgi:hypothetical protein